MKKVSVVTMVSDITLAAATASFALSGIPAIATPVEGKLPEDTGEQIAERVMAVINKYRLINSAVNDATFRNELDSINPATVDGVHRIVVDPSMFTSRSDSTKDIFSGELPLMMMYDTVNQDVVQVLNWYAEHESELESLSVQDPDERQEFMKLIAELDSHVTPIDYDWQLLGKITMDSFHLQQMNNATSDTSVAA